MPNPLNFSASAADPDNKNLDVGVDDGTQPQKSRVTSIAKKIVVAFGGLMGIAALLPDKAVGQQYYGGGMPGYVQPHGSSGYVGGYPYGGGYGGYGRVGGYGGGYGGYGRGGSYWNSHSEFYFNSPAQPLSTIVTYRMDDRMAHYYDQQVARQQGYVAPAVPAQPVFQQNNFNNNGDVYYGGPGAAEVYPLRRPKLIQTNHVDPNTGEVLYSTYHTE